MKYEFNVGDYVETTDGYKGKIAYMSKIYPKNIYFNVSNCMQEEWLFSEEELIEAIENNVFIHIGKYDFTKPQKIERLEYDILIKNMAKKVEIKTDNESSEGLQNAYIKTTDIEIIDKINEIIDRLNEMSEEDED